MIHGAEPDGDPATSASSATGTDGPPTSAASPPVVDHPNLVKIHSFVQHPGSDGVPVGYLVMEYDRQLKLIDMGAVIRMDDERSAVFGTAGDQVSEIGRPDPTRVARALPSVGPSAPAARLSTSPAERVALVDRANAVRPRTWM